jgi:ketosteroid isomerase-like protein
VSPEDLDIVSRAYDAFARGDLDEQLARLHYRARFAEREGLTGAAAAIEADR